MFPAPRHVVVAVLIATTAGATPAAAQDRVVELLSDNPATTNDLNASVSEAAGADSGTRAIFTTTEPMLASDTDGSPDVYARNADGSLTHVSDSAVSATDLEKPVGYGTLSADGSRVFFRTAERLTATDDDDSLDVYARNADGSLTCVSDNPATFLGDAAEDVSFGGASADGSRVFFGTSESMDSGDTDTAQDVYARDADGGISFISGSAANPDPEITAYFVGSSADGSRVFFGSTEPRSTFADTDASSDVYARNANGTLSLLTDHPTTNPDAEVDASFVGASADGSRVFFETREQILSSDSDSSTDVYARNGNGSLSHISDNPGTIADPFSTAVFGAASADGARVFFDTEEQIVGADTDAKFDVYAREADGGLTLVSDRPGGATDGKFDANAVDASADGRRAFFRTAERLTDDDRDSATDAYASDDGGALTLLTDNPSTAEDNGIPAVMTGASADGSIAFFTTAEPMVPGDSDIAADLYRSRPAPPASGDPGGGGPSAPAGGQGTGGQGAGGPPTGDPATRDGVSPVVNGLTMARSFRAARSGGPIAARTKAVGTIVRYGLSEPATATFTVERPTTGRRSGRSCVKPTRKNRRKRRCTRWVRVGKPFAHAGVAGSNAFKFTGRPGRKLAPGSYRLAVAAADGAGNRSAPKRRTFRIVRR